MNKKFSLRILPTSWAFPLFVSFIENKGTAYFSVGFLCLHGSVQFWSPTPWLTDWRGTPHKDVADIWARFADKIESSDSLRDMKIRQPDPASEKQP